MDLTHARWRKPSRSSAQGQCVEVATNLQGFSAVRDSKDRDGKTLVLTTARFADFIGSIKAGRFGSEAP
ncbi:MAG: DUF397 domain-containing protein [Saccharopolyspora sp.]|uniref:DUF397 domain-containing protein n=1 Tax=Saccharopolyspora sp. TaxID=33915 RepID=UPI0025D792BD|nr:DUF397 domain-containing protein [Saccharopolyspora sp.]MBQ6643308.1 DUF397 domain-containing protein [Saccharopolyspora sp.]